MATGLALLGPLAHGQDGARAFSITPLLSISQSITDNRDLRSVDKESDAVTQISPGIRVFSRTGRLQGSLDYSLNAQIHARSGVGNDLQNALSAAFTAEAIENRAFVDVRAAISQQSISAFGVQSASNTVTNTNRTEVATVSVSPYVRGTVAGVVDVSARATHSITHAKSGPVSDSTSSSVSLGASGRSGQLGWSADASEQVSDFDTGRRTSDGRIGAGMNFNPDPDVRLSARAGLESNDVLSAQRKQTASWGVGLDWNPSERTSLSLQRDKRYFGSSHTVSLQYRMPRSVWRLSDTQDASTFTAGGSAAVTNYDLLYAQFASIEPDPGRRDALVRNFLATNGIDPNSSVSGGFLNSAVSLLHRQDLSMSWQGLRASVLLSAFRTETRRLDTLTPGQDDLSRAGIVRQLGYTVNLGWRLTPTATVNLGATRLKTPDSGSISGNDQRAYTALLSEQLGLRVSVSFSLRHSTFDSVVRPYTENAAAATFSFRF